LVEGSNTGTGVLCIEEALPVLRSCLRQLRLVVSPYFDVTPFGPEAAFAAQASRHPAFLLTRPSGWHPAAI